VSKADSRIVLRPENLNQFIGFVKGLDLSAPMQFDWKPYKSSRSLDQNALMWKWLTFMASHFSSKKGGFSKDDMHDLMRHKFLGYVDKTVGKTVIPPQLRSTKDLDVGEMHHYLTNIDMWAASCGCLLPRPEGSVYDQMIREEAAGA